MSTEKPTTPKDDTTQVSPTEHWREMEVRTGSEPNTDGEAVASKGEPEGDGEKRGRGSLPRRARFLVAAALIVFAAGFAWIVVSALVGGGSTPQSRHTPGGLKAGKASGERSSRTRWVREPDQAARPQRRRTAPAASHVRHHAQPRHEPRPPASPPQGIPSQPPVSGAASEPAPEPSAPAPPPPSEPAGKPGLRDGATESTEFGL